MVADGLLNARKQLGAPMPRTLQKIAISAVLGILNTRPSRTVAPSVDVIKTISFAAHS
jgi:hypothetical protein